MIIVILSLIEYSYCAGLLRTPKVYNALITTDQNLTPSRSYPVIQPTIHESPFFYPPYSFSPLGFYDPYGPFNSFGNTQGLFARYNQNYNNINRGENLNGLPNSVPGNIPNGNNPNGNVNAERSFIVNSGKTSDAAGNAKHDNAIGNPNTEKSPIPLNEFGLPPSLIPISPYNAINQNPIDLAPYNYNSYPLIFDQYGGFQQGPYLPHYGFVPQTAYATLSGDKNQQQTQNGQNIVPQGVSGSPGDAAAGSSLNRPGGTISENNEFQSVIGLSGPSNSNSASSNGQESSNQIYFDRENRVGQDINSDGFSQAASNNGDGSSRSDQHANFQGQSASTSSESQSSSSEVSLVANLANQSNENNRSSKVFYVRDDIKNNKNGDGNIVDVPPPPLPFGAKSSDNK